MGEILGRGQHQLAQREIAGVEIQRPRLRFSGLCGIFLFPAVGRQLDFDQPLGIERPLEGEKDLFQARPHRGVVVAGFDEVEPRAFPRDRPPRLDGPLSRPVQSVVIPAECGQQEQDGGVGSWFAHGNN